MAKILLIEDDASIASLYKTELSLRGHTVEHLATGSGVLEKSKSFKPDIVLLDIQLPDRDGLTILTDLKADAETKNIPVLMVTNYSDDANVSKALDAGAADFIPKFRIVPEELGKKIESLV